MQPFMIFLRDCAVIEDSIYFHPTQSIQYSHSITRTRRISLIEHIKETRNGNWKSFFFSSSNTIAEIPSESGVLRHTGSSAGVNTSPLIGALLLVLFRMSVLRLRLLLLDILSLTLSLLIELLVLGFDFGSTMLRFTAAAGPAIFVSYKILHFVWSRCTHVNSTLILRGGYLPSSNMEWW